MEKEIVLQNEWLWNRLKSFSPDEEMGRSFSQKLAREENWSPAFTERAIEEYKKFIYLCCTLPDGASPSRIVDKVWHMHLLYTQNYWEEFCPNILRFRLHHYPSKWGSEEKQKHKLWFDNTLKHYQEIFGQPPADIWIHKKERRNPKMNLLTMISAVGLLLTLSSCSDGIGNVSALFLFIFLISWLFGRNKDAESQNKGQNGNDGGSGSCGGGNSSGCSSSCGSSCGGGCGGCGGGD